MQSRQIDQADEAVSETGVPSPSPGTRPSTARRSFLQQSVWAAGVLALPGGFMLTCAEGKTWTLSGLPSGTAALSEGVLALHWDQPCFDTSGGAHPFRVQAMAPAQPHRAWSESEWRMQHPYL
jgi:hypothetical protein